MVGTKLLISHKIAPTLQHAANTILLNQILTKAFHRLAYAANLAALTGISACTTHPTAPVMDLSLASKNQASYSVLSGDTLFGIAFRSGVSVQDLARWNGLKAPYTIYVGSNLKLSAKSAEFTDPDFPNQPTLLAEPQKSVKVVQKPEQSQPKKVASTPLPKVELPPKVEGWIWPTKGKLIQTFSLKKGINGIQIAAVSASPVAAAAEGQVVYAGNGIGGYGQLIIIQHSNEFLSAYAHNNTILVKEGQKISQGQKIAEVGNTGTNTTKLHFEIRKDGRPVNPLNYLPLKSA